MVPCNSIKGRQSRILFGLVIFFFFGGWTGLGINASSSSLQRTAIQVDGQSSINDGFSSSIQQKMVSLNQLQEISSHEQALEDQIMLALTQDKENIVVLGKNQTGKSTLISCLLDQPVQGKMHEDGDFFLSCSGPLLPTISRVSTPWVDIWSKKGDKRVYWEFSGIIDPEDVTQRNADHDGWQWIALQKILHTLNVKVMMVAPYTGGRSSHPKLYNMLSLVTEIFSLQELQMNTCLVVTKAEPEINIPIHLQQISQDITENTALISSDGKSLLAYWAKQREAKIIGFPVPTEQGLIDVSLIKQHLKQSLEQLSLRGMSLNSCRADASLVLPTSQVRAKNIHQFLQESEIGVVTRFCQDLSLLLDGINTSVLDLPNYWQSFEKGTTRVNRQHNDLLKFLTFVTTTDNSPDLSPFLQELQGVFGKEGETASTLLRTLERLRGHEGFVDINKTSLRQKIDEMSRLIINSKEEYFKEDIRQELIDHYYLKASSLISSLPSPSLSEVSTPTYSPPSITVHVSFDKISLEQGSEDESKQDSSKQKKQRTASSAIASGNTTKMGADNTLKVGTDNDVSILSAKVTVEKPLGDQPCKECCEGLRYLCWDIRACCWGSAEGIPNTQQENTTLLKMDR